MANRRIVPGMALETQLTPSISVMRKAADNSKAVQEARAAALSDIRAAEVAKAAKAAKKFANVNVQLPALPYAAIVEMLAGIERNAALWTVKPDNAETKAAYKKWFDALVARYNADPAKFVGGDVRDRWEKSYDAFRLVGDDATVMVKSGVMTIADAEKAFKAAQASAKVLQDALAATEAALSA